MLGNDTIPAFTSGLPCYNGILEGSARIRIHREGGR